MAAGGSSRSSKKQQQQQDIPIRTYLLVWWEGPADTPLVSVPANRPVGNYQQQAIYTLVVQGAPLDIYSNNKNIVSCSAPSLHYVTTATTNPYSGRLLRSVQKDQQLAIWTLRRPSSPPLRWNNNNQPESSWLYCSIWMEQHRLIQVILRTVARLG